MTVGVLGQPGSPFVAVPLRSLSDVHRTPAGEIRAYMPAGAGMHGVTPDGRVLVEVPSSPDVLERIA